MRPPLKAAVVCLLAAFTLFVVSHQTVAEPSARIAALYTEAAYEAYESSDIDRAIRLAAVAREFDRDSSDVLYVSALAAAARQDHTRAALALAELAVRNGAWRRFSSPHGALLLAQLYNRVGDHEAAIAAATVALPAATPDAVRSGLLFEELYAYEARSRLGAADGVTAARERFPDDPRFAWFLLRLERFPSVEYRREVERLLRVGVDPPSGPGLSELLWEYASRAPTPAERRWAVGVLGRTGWDDPRIALLIAEQDEPVARFLQFGGLSRYSVYRNLLARTAGQARRQLLDAAASYTGTSVIVSGWEGMWVERLNVTDGLIVRWERDHDRDGIAEMTLEFGPLEPHLLFLADTEAAVRLRYGQYPFLTEGELDIGDGFERFVLRPRTVRVDAIVSLPPDGPRFDSDVALRPAIRTVTRDELTAAAVRIDRVRADGSVAERAYRDRGVTTQVLRDESGNGRWDRMLILENGVPVAGVRDLTGDGSFEVAEGYRDGRLVALAIDTDGDGVPNVFETEDGVPVREWDLNGDGRIDAREFRFWTDSVVLEFPIEERLR